MSECESLCQKIRLPNESDWIYPIQSWHWGPSPSCRLHEWCRWVNSDAFAERATCTQPDQHVFYLDIKRTLSTGCAAALYFIRMAKPAPKNATNVRDFALVSSCQDERTFSGNFILLLSGRLQGCKTSMNYDESRAPVSHLNVDNWKPLLPLLYALCKLCRCCLFIQCEVLLQKKSSPAGMIQPEPHLDIVLNDYAVAVYYVNVAKSEITDGLIFKALSLRLTVTLRTSRTEAFQIV